MQKDVERFTRKDGVVELFDRLQSDVASWPVFIRFIGRHQQDQNTTNGKRITRKWPLGLSSTANEVTAFQTDFVFDVFDLKWVETH